MDYAIDPQKEFPEVRDFVSTFGVVPVPVVLIKHPESQSGRCDNEAENKLRLLKDRKYMMLQIDITHRKKDLLPIIDDYISHYKSLLDTPGTKLKITECYKIYDMKKEGVE